VVTELTANRTIRKYYSHAEADSADADYYESLTMAERVEMMWPLAVQAWAFMGEDIAESRLSRHIVRIQRSRS